MSTTATATKSVKSNSAKANKSAASKLSPLQSGVVKSLLAIIDSIKAQEITCPTFEPSDAVKLLRSHKLDMQADMIEESERAAFDKLHGDAESQAKKALRDLLNEGMGSALADNGLSMVRKTNAGADRKERVTLNDAQRKEVCDIRRAYLAEREKPEAERNQSIIIAGQIGQIASAFNVSNPTVSKLLDEAGLTNKRETTTA